MAVASAERGGDRMRERVTPSLGEARALADKYNLIPVSQTFIDDTETPVAAFLKLRGEGPAFLLESAEQGRGGRYSFIGFNPPRVLRWSPEAGGRPYALAAAAPPESGPTWPPGNSRPRLPASSSTSAPATLTRWSPLSAGRRRSPSKHSRSIAGCGRSTPVRTCTSSTSATSRSLGRARSR